MKRIAAIMIASLFVLTAFAVVEMPLNATVNHIPVPFTYAQSSSAKPYVATSNGLTYTVEPNGTYLWNGHYLRAPPVPYPKVPTIAPDGLPYGAVKSGAQGHVGPYSFTKGPAQIKGVTPNGTAGKATIISKTTSWDNTTVYLGGNVTWTGQYQLFINNTKVIFNESYGSQAWQYGFNGTIISGSAGHFLLNILDNSVIAQKNTTSRPFYISLSWPDVSVGSSAYYFGTIVSNSTIYSNGTETSGLTDGYYSTQGGILKEDGPIGLEINYFNNSAYYGITPLSVVPNNGIGYGNISASQNGWVGTFVFHSYISDGFARGEFWNDTFVNSTIYPMRSLNYYYMFLGKQINYAYLDYDTVIGLSTWRWLSFVNFISGVNYETFINHTLIENSNITNSSFFAAVPTPLFSIQNTTFSNITFVQKGIPTVGNYDPESPSGAAAFQHSAGNSEVIVGAFTPSTSSEGNFSMVHSSFINVSSNYGPMRIVGFNDRGIDQSAYMRYDVFENLSDIISIYNGGDVSVYKLSGRIANATGIIMKNVRDVFVSPWTGDHSLMANNSFAAIYAFGDGQTGYDWQVSHRVSSGSGGYAANNNSWYINISRTAGGLMANGFAPIVEDNNVFITVNNTVAIGMGTSSGLSGFSAKNNSIYGLYNYSLGAGGYDTGGDINSHLINVNVYDVSTSSVSYTAQQDSISFVNIDGNLIGINANGTLAQTVPSYPPVQSTPVVDSNSFVWIKHSAEINIINSTITQLILADLREGYAYPVYTPSLLQNEFNITIENSYIPATFTARTNSDLTDMHNTTENLFSYASGSQWLMSSPFSNPSFLNLTGYLGIYPSQTYTLNASNIKGESSLPVYLAGSQIASIPASSAHYNLTASYSSGTLEYSVSANSASDQPISLIWNGQVPNTAYSVAMYDHGQLIDYTNVTSSANGVVTFTYNPATMPLDPVFELTTFHIVTSGSTAVPPEVFLYVLLAGGALLGAGAIIVAAVDRRRYR